MEKEIFDIITHKSKIAVKTLMEIISVTNVFKTNLEQIEEFSKSIPELGSDNINEEYYKDIVGKISNMEQLFNDFLREINVLKNDPKSIMSKLIEEGNLCDLFKGKFPFKHSFDLLQNKCILNLNNIVKRTCIIVNISKKLKEVYIYDLTNYDIYKNFFILMKNFTEEMKPMNRLPRCGEIFGVKFSGVLYRAIKENTISQSKFICCFLLDYGIEIPIEANDSSVFELPTDLKLFPSLAVRCKLNSFSTQDSEITNENFYDIVIDSRIKFNFKLVRKQDYMWFIDLEKYHNPFSDYLTEIEQLELNILPENFGNKLNIQNELCEPDFYNIREKNLLRSFKKLEINNENNFRIGQSIYQLTDNEKTILYEEPFNTSNAMKAVMGYEPQDDKLICKHARDGECFKGGNCLLSHEKKLMNGWTRDKEMVIVGNKCTLEIPEINSIITITPTAIESCTTFFAHINNLESYHEPSLSELTKQWNSYEELSKYKCFTSNMPALFELVLAKYVDGYFYRARIIQQGDENFVIVIYLDYGNVSCVSINDLRKWEPKFEIIPCKAVHFTFDNVKIIPERKNELLRFLRTNFLNNVYKARVINNIDTLYVQIYKEIDKTNFLDELVINGFLYKIPNIYPTDMQRVPGAIDKLVEFQRDFLTGCYRKKRALFIKCIKKYIYFTSELLQIRKTLKFPQTIEIFYNNGIEPIQQLEKQAVYYKIEFKENAFEQNLNRVEILIGSNIKIFQDIMPLSSLWFNSEYDEFTNMVLDGFDLCSWNVKSLCIEYFSKIIRSDNSFKLHEDQLRSCVKLLQKLPLAVETDCLELKQAEIIINNLFNYFNELEKYIKCNEFHKCSIEVENFILILGEILLSLSDKHFDIFSRQRKSLITSVNSILENVILYNKDLNFNKQEIDKIFSLIEINFKFLLSLKSTVLTNIKQLGKNMKNLTEISEIWCQIHNLLEKMIIFNMNDIESDIRTKLNCISKILLLINILEFEHLYINQIIDENLNTENTTKYKLIFINNSKQFENNIISFLKSLKKKNNVEIDAFKVIVEFLNNLIQNEIFKGFSPNNKKFILDFLLQYINKIINLPNDFPFEKIHQDNNLNKLIIKTLSNLKAQHLEIPIQNHVFESIERILHRTFMRDDLQNLQQCILSNLLKFILNKTISHSIFEQKIVVSIKNHLKNPILLINNIQDLICYFNYPTIDINLNMKEKIFVISTFFDDEISYKIICMKCADYSTKEKCSNHSDKLSLFKELCDEYHGILKLYETPSSSHLFLKENELLKICDIINEENASNIGFQKIINHCDFSKSSVIINSWYKFLPKICCLTLKYSFEIKDKLFKKYIGDLLDMVKKCLENNDPDEQKQIIEILNKYSLCNDLPEIQIYYLVKLCIMFLIRYESHVPYLAIDLAQKVCSKYNITTNNILNWYQRQIIQLIANLSNAIYLCHGIKLQKSLEYVSHLFGYKGAREFLLRHQDLFVTMVLPQVIENKDCEKLLEEVASYTKMSLEDLLRNVFLTFYLEHFIREKTNFFNRCLDYIIEKTKCDFFNLISLENKKTVAKMLMYYHKNPKTVMDSFRCLLLKEANPNNISNLSTLTQRTTTDITNFLADGFLGVLNYFEMYLMGSDFQKDLKSEILLSLGEIMRFLGTKYITQFHFKILAMLSTTLNLDDFELKKISIEAWKIFIHNIDVPTLGPSLSRIVASLEPLLKIDQEQINSIFKFLIIENGNLLSMYIPDLFFIAKLNISQDIRLFVAQQTEKKLRTNNLQDKIEFYLKQVTHENVIIRIYGLKYLETVFSDNRRGLNKMILGQNFINPILENVLGNLMLGCKHSDYNLKLVSAKCIGELGAIEPGLMRPNYSAQEKNFPLSVHSDSFAIMALKELCKAYQFQKNTHYVDNFSLGIQEILRTCGVSPKQKTKMEVWNAIPERMKQIMEPLLTSCYTGMQKIENTQIHPLYGSHCSKTYVLWAFYWAANVVNQIEDSNTKHLLHSLLPSLRRDTNILDAFLPYIILHGLQSGNEVNQNHIFEELNFVFQDILHNDIKNIHSNENNISHNIKLVSNLIKTSKKMDKNEIDFSYKENIGKKCAKIGFDLLDFLERWMREYYFVYSNETEPNYIAIKKFINSFNKFELAQANFNCGEYARALKYCEAHLKLMSKGNQSSILQENLSFLIKIYVELMDTDSLEGAVYLKQSQSSLREQILVNSMTDKLQETAACYEQLIKEKEVANELNTLTALDWDGIVQCYLRLDTPETALLVSQGIMNKLAEQFTDECLKESHIEPLWRLGKFEELENLLKQPGINESKNWPVLYGRALLLFQKGDIAIEQFEKNVDDIRHNVLKIMKFGTADCDSYHKVYSQVTKLHLLTDIEKCRYLIDRISNIPYEHESISILTTFFDDWNARLDFLQPTIKVTEPFLCLHRVLLTETKNLLRSNQNFSIFEELIDNEIGKLWIRSVQLNLEAGCYQQAHLNILNAEKYKPDNLFVEKAKLFWVKNDQPNSFKVIEDKISEIEKLEIDPLPVDKRLLYAEAKYLQASYNAESMNINPDLNKKYFNESIKNNNKSEKCYVALAEFHDKIFTTLERSVQQSEYGQRTLLSILYNYSKSLQYGCEFLYQSMPRMLSIWFDINDINSGGVYRIQSSNSQMTNPYLRKINELMEQSAQGLPLFLYFTAFSQIISRVCHPSEDVWRTIKNIVVRLIEKYSQHSLWMILPVFKSSLPSRIRRCHDIFNDKRLKNVQTQKLIKDFNSFAEKIIEFTNTPIERGQTPNVSDLVPSLPKLLRERDFSPVMIPFEKYLQMSLPSLGQRSCSLNSFDPFPNNLVYIHGIREEIITLNSLQRPKRTILIGSDGKDYTILLKPNDDLRKDFRLMEFNNIVKQYLYQDPKARQRRLGIRTYAVMPLNEECGIIEWVNNLQPFRQILIELYKSRKIGIMSVRELKKFGEKENDLQKRRERYIKELLARHPPIFYEWFLERFSNPHNWYQARTTFIQSTAVMSIVGYILGLGDRHGENILMDGKTGDAVHVDFNCLFNRAELFAFPEKVPFRLTHNMVDAMGPLGTEGPFKKCCEITMHVLKANTPILMSVLKPFIYDPLVSWNKKSIKNDKNVERTDDGAIINVQRTEARLKGYVNHETTGANMPLSPEGVVNYVIQKATDIDNLAAMYVGWGPYL